MCADEVSSSQVGGNMVAQHERHVGQPGAQSSAWAMARSNVQARV